MDDSLKKFNQLPLPLKNRLSSPDFLGAIEILERQYNVKLASVFIKLVVKDLMLAGLSNYLISNLKLDVNKARIINQKLIDLLSKLQAETSTKPMVAKVSGEIDRDRSMPVKFGNQPSVNSGKVNFSFSSEDEKEVERFKNVAASAPSQQIDQEKTANELIKEFGYKETDDIYIKRLKNAILARLKDVRDELETINVLEKSKKVGGLEFSADDSRRLLALIKNHLSSGGTINQASSDVKKLEFPEKRPFKTKTEKIDLQEKISTEIIKIKPEIKAVAPAVPAKNSMTSKVVSSGFREPAPAKRPVNIVPPAPSAMTPPATSKIPVISKISELPTIETENGLPVIRMPGDLDHKPAIIKTELSLAPKVTHSLPPPQPQPSLVSNKTELNMVSAQASRKPRLDDVRFSKKLVGPVEELGIMTLIDFRRMSQQPKEITRKIEEKISLLEKDSYGRRIEGIDAWYKNEVNKFYRLLGQKSMSEGKSIETVINERLADGKPTLSLDEFMAVMELNKKLRF